MGSCGLRVVHGVLQIGHKPSKGNINTVIQIFCKPFHRSTFRCTDY